MGKDLHKGGKKKAPGKKGEAPYNRYVWLAVAAIVVICFMAYSKVLTFNFSNLDDTANILSNKQITALSPEHLKEMFSKTYVQMYVPLTMVSYATDYFFAGGFNPAYFHFFNLLYHLIDIVLVFVFIQKLSKSNITAVVATALFALHPMNVETVAWVSTRSSLLYTGLGLATLLFYIMYLEHNYGFKYLAASILFFALSLLTKPALILLPLLLLCIDYYKNRKFDARLIYDKIPFGLLSAVFLVVILYSRSSDVATNSEAYSIINRLFFATYGLSFYTTKLFAPVNLCVINPFPTVVNGYLPVVYYLSGLIIPLFGWAIYKAGKLKKDVVFGLAFFVINLLLVLQLLPYGYSVVSERYVYLPYLGLFLIIGQFCNGIYNGSFGFSDKVKPYLTPALLVISVTLTIATYTRAEVWQNPLTLFDDAIAKQPDSYYTLYSAGVAQTLYNNTQAAMSDYNRALQLKPDYAEAYAARGTLYDAQNDSKDALADYNKALQLAPYLYDTYYNRGNNKLKANNFTGAIKDYDVVIGSNPNYDAAICNRGTAWLNLNNLQNACKDWTNAAAQGNKNAVLLMGQHCK